MDFRPCILIPCYNHGKTIPSLLDAMEAFKLPILVVDDGSDAASKAILSEQALRPEVTLLTLETNQGKGEATMHGFREADRAGFTHALQIDADGQHDVTAIPAMLEAARKHPKDLVSGRPVFDASIPRIRYYGRYLTHFMVWLETLSFSIKDSMCGLRVYPVQACLQLMDRVRIGKRMDFDTDIMVRLYWSGCRVHFVGVHVTYPKDGLSNFDGLRDNARMTSLHIRLILGMLPRSWGLIRRHDHKRHWSSQAERGTVLGIRFLLFVYSVLGRRVFGWFLKPVMFYFFITAKSARLASREFIHKVTACAERQQITFADKLTPFKNFMSFGFTILDNLVAWKGEDLSREVTRHGMEHYNAMMARERGVVIIGSHLGSMEVCRAVGHHNRRRVVNALVFTKHAKRINSVMNAINPGSNFNLIQVSELGLDTAILLKQKIEQGEWVVIVADRTPVARGQRVVWADFLGESAPFPQGPFMLAALLQEPVYLMFGLRDDGTWKPRYHVFIELFHEKVEIPRHRREEVLKEIVSRYASRLEYHALRWPLQWYNFFPFWQLNKSHEE